MKRAGILFCFLLFFLPAHAQEDTTGKFTILPTVDFLSNRMITFGSGYEAERTDSLLGRSMNQSTLAEFLSVQTTAYIKNYGSSGLATSSIRGGSASHTLIAWNGFNISSSVNGQTDLNLLPGGSNLDWKFFPGGSSTYWGSGGIAGTLLLETSALKKNETALATEFHSYNDSRNSIMTSVGTKKVYSTTRFWYNSAANNFNYSNTAKPGSPIEQQTHAFSKSLGGMQDIAYVISNKQELNFHFWTNKSFREIPPTMLQQESAAAQSDYFTRIAADYLYKWKGNQAFLRAGFFNDQLRYNDSVARISSYSDSDKIIIESETRFHKYNSKNWFQAGVNFQHAAAANSGYSEKHVMDLYAFFASWKHQGNKSEASANVRQEYTSLYRIPFVFSVSARRKISNSIRISGQASRNFRLPTFNDLYWSPGGNTALKPESGWSEEIKAEISPLKKKKLLRYSVTAFNRNIRNWIIWIPGDSYWSPENILNVWSRGIENRIDLICTFKKFQLISVLKYDYIRSTDESVSGKGRQLIYIPHDMVNATMTAKYKRCWIGLSYHMTGYRFISTDHTQWLPSWDVINFYSGFNLQRKKYTSEFYFRVNNILDQPIYAMPWQPMPGRNYTIGIKLNLSLSNSEN